MVAERPAGEPVEQPVGPGGDHGEQRRLARIEVETARGVGMDDRVDRVPARFDHELLDRKRALLDEAADREPAAAIVTRKKRTDQPLLPLEPSADRLPVGDATRRGLALHSVVDEPVLQGNAIDARHRADPADDPADRHGCEERVQAPPRRRLGSARHAGEHRGHAAEVGEPAEKSGDPILRRAANTRAVPHRHFQHPVPRERYQRGDEAVHVGGELQVAGHLAAEGLQPTVVVMQPQPGDPADEQVEDPRGECLVPGIEPRRLPAVDEPRALPLVEQVEHPRDFGGIILAVAVEHGHVATAASLKPGHQRRRLAEPASVLNPLHAIVGRGRRDDLGPRAVGRPVIDHEGLPGKPRTVERVADLRHQRGDVPRLVADRNDEGHVGRSHGRLDVVGGGREAARIPRCGAKRPSRVSRGFLVPTREDPD